MRRTSMDDPPRFGTDEETVVAPEDVEVSTTCLHRVRVVPEVPWVVEGVTGGPTDGDRGRTGPGVGWVQDKTRHGQNDVREPFQ